MYNHIKKQYILLLVVSLSFQPVMGVEGVKGVMAQDNSSADNGCPDITNPKCDKRAPVDKPSI